MGFFSGICSFVSGACSIIGGAIGSLGNAVSRALSIVGSALSSAVINVVMGVGKILGAVNEKDRPEELGMKAVKAEKRLEDFDNYKEYKSYLDSIELTKEDMKKMEEHKVAYSYIGTGVCLQGIKETYEMPLTIGTFINLVKMGINDENKVKVVLDEYKEKNVRPDIDKMISGKNITPMESDKVLEVLNEALKKIENSSEIEEKLNKMLNQ